MSKEKSSDTLIIQITHKKALKLLLQLEELDLIRVLEHKPAKRVKLSEKYAGILSADTGKKLQKHVIKSRDEWENRS